MLKVTLQVLFYFETHHFAVHGMGTQLRKARAENPCERIEIPKVELQD